LILIRNIINLFIFVFHIMEYYERQSVPYVWCWLNYALFFKLDHTILNDILYRRIASDSPTYNPHVLFLNFNSSMTRHHVSPRALPGQRGASAVVSRRPGPSPVDHRSTGYRSIRLAALGAFQRLTGVSGERLTDQRLISAKLARRMMRLC